MSSLKKRRVDDDSNQGADDHAGEEEELGESSLLGGPAAEDDDDGDADDADELDDGEGEGGVARRRAGTVDVAYAGYEFSGDGEATVERVGADIDPREFFDRFVKRRKPAILSGLLTDEAWKAGAWDDAYLREHAGTQVVHVERKGSGGGYGTGDPKVLMQFAELLDRLQQGDDSLYLTTQPEADAQKQAPARAIVTAPLIPLLGDFPLQPRLFGNLRPHQINIWMGHQGGAGASSGLHHDFHDNLYVLLRGAKKFLLFSPADAPRLPTHGPMTRVHPNGLINYFGLPTREDGAGVSDAAQYRVSKAEEKIAQLEAENKGTERAEAELEEALDALISDAAEEEVEDEDGATTNGQPDNFCTLSAEEAFQLPGARPCVCEIKAGEMLYIPASYYHNVTSAGGTHVAFNYWMAPPTSDATFEEPYPDSFWADQFEIAKENL